MGTCRSVWDRKPSHLTANRFKSGALSRQECTVHCAFIRGRANRERAYSAGQTKAASRILAKGLREQGICGDMRPMGGALYRRGQPLRPVILDVMLP